MRQAGPFGKPRTAFGVRVHAAVVKIALITASLALCASFAAAFDLLGPDASTGARALMGMLTVISVILVPVTIQLANAIAWTIQRE